MRLLLTVLAAVALLAPPAAQAHNAGHARKLAQRDSLIHGIAGDRNHVFVTEPGAGVSTAGPRVVVLDRDSGREVATLPPPPGGFKLPFTLRVPRPGHLVVLDSGGFPPVGPPVVYDYRYSGGRFGFHAVLTRTADFAGLPLGFAEDVEVLPNGEYVVSESVFGGLWLIGRDGTVRPGLVPDPGGPPLPKLGPCLFPDGPFTVGGLPFAGGGNFAPGAGSLAVRGRYLYFSSTCEGGVQRLPIRTLLDGSRPAAERAAEIQTVAERQYPLESLKGITFNRWKPFDPWIYAGDPFRLQLIRIDSRTGRREVLSTDDRLFDFTTATAFLPPKHLGQRNPLVTASDQEYRWATLNVALDHDMFRPPFVVAEFWPR
ncbi:MAG TPA: hypothetical protein VFG79_02015 [Solirubrobacter sp.]|nr:hypothetical protein [Solirubrobacter sp.]